MSFIIHEHTIPGSHIREYAHSTANDQDEPLMIHVKRYVPKDYLNPRQGDLTIVGAHANGFPKELYEPMWEYLYQSLKKKNIQIRGIWITDAAWQGQSSYANRNSLGNDHSWHDYSRDIGQMINTFRLPRPLMGVGHSFGGCAITGLSLMHPRLFSSIMLLDPVIDVQDSKTRKNILDPRNGPSPASLSARRRDKWPSREDAAASFKKSAFYQSWDPEVLECWIKFGLRDLPGGAVTLSTPKAMEVGTFLRPTFRAYNKEGTKVINPTHIPDADFTYVDESGMFPVYRPESAEVYRKLPHVRPSVLYVFGGDSYMSKEDRRRMKMEHTGTGIGGSGGVKAGRVEQVVAEGYGHLVPMEAPSYCADALSNWIERELVRWQKEEDDYAEWASQPTSSKNCIDPDLDEALQIHKRSKI